MRSNFKANWDPKPDNLRAIAAELNPGLDSCVFVDDDPAEIEIVRQFTPEIATIALTEDPSDYVRQLQESRLLERFQITGEDTERTGQYLDEARRRVLLSTAGDMESYLRSLAMEGDCRALHPLDLPRIAQLVNKSNQFNLTTRRRTEAELTAVMNDAAYKGFSIRLRDRRLWADRRRDLPEGAGRRLRDRHMADELPGSEAPGRTANPKSHRGGRAFYGRPYRARRLPADIEKRHGSRSLSRSGIHARERKGKQVRLRTIKGWTAAATNVAMNTEERSDNGAD